MSHIESPKYNITRYRSDNDDNAKKASYELSENQVDPWYNFENEKEVANSEPTVKGIKPNKPIPIKQKNKL